MVLSSKKSRTDKRYFLLQRDCQECGVIFKKVVINLQCIIELVAKLTNNAKKDYREKSNFLDLIKWCLIYHLRESLSPEDA